MTWFVYFMLLLSLLYCHGNSCFPVKEGDSCTLTCRGQLPNKDWRISWQMDQVIIAECDYNSCLSTDQRFGATVASTLDHQLSSSLTISNVSAEDRGKHVRCLSHFKPVAEWTLWAVYRQLNMSQCETLSLGTNLTRITCAVEQLYPEMVCQLVRAARSRSIVVPTNFAYEKRGLIKDDFTASCTTVIATALLAKETNYVRIFPTWNSEESVKRHSAGYRLVRIPKSASGPGPKVTITKSVPIMDACPGSSAKLNCGTDGFDEKLQFEWQVAKDSPIFGNECGRNSTLSFPLAASDNNKLVLCKATPCGRNTGVSVPQNDTILLEVRYPPPEPPKFYLEGGGGGLANRSAIKIIDGGSVLLRCDVMGGNPEVSSVEIVCQYGNHSQVPSNGESKGSSAYLNLNGSRSLIGAHCVCSAVHDTKCYNLTAVVHFLSDVDRSSPWKPLSIKYIILYVLVGVFISVLLVFAGGMLPYLRSKWDTFYAYYQRTYVDHAENGMVYSQPRDTSRSPAIVQEPLLSPTSAHPYVNHSESAEQNSLFPTSNHTNLAAVAATGVASEDEYLMPIQQQISSTPETENRWMPTRSAGDFPQPSGLKAKARAEFGLMSTATVDPPRHQRCQPSSSGPEQPQNVFNRLNKCTDSGEPKAIPSGLNIISQSVSSDREQDLPMSTTWPRPPPCGMKTTKQGGVAASPNKARLHKVPSDNTPGGALNIPLPEPQQPRPESHRRKPRSLTHSNFDPISSSSGKDEADRSVHATKQAKKSVSFPSFPQGASLESVDEPLPPLPPRREGFDGIKERTNFNPNRRVTAGDISNPSTGQSRLSNTRTQRPELSVHCPPLSSAVRPKRQPRTLSGSDLPFTYTDTTACPDLDVRDATNTSSAGRPCGRVPETKAFKTRTAKKSQSYPILHEPSFHPEDEQNEGCSEDDESPPSLPPRDQFCERVNMKPGLRSNGRIANCEIDQEADVITTNHITTRLRAGSGPLLTPECSETRPPATAATAKSSNKVSVDKPAFKGRQRSTPDPLSARGADHPLLWHHTAHGPSPSGSKTSHRKSPPRPCEFLSVGNNFDSPPPLPPRPKGPARPLLTVERLNPTCSFSVEEEDSSGQYSLQAEFGSDDDDSDSATIPESASPSRTPLETPPGMIASLATKSSSPLYLSLIGEHTNS